jgi:transposase-like protein
MVGLRPVGARSAGDPDLHVGDELILVAAVGIDGRGEKHPLGLVEGATENAATVQALLDNLVERGLDPAGVWLFIIDGAKALSKAIRRTFGKDTPIQRCQVHKARNITERLPKSLHASVRRTLRQAWEMDDAAKAERLVRNLARRLEKDWPGISATILEGLEEILCVVRLGLPQDLRRSLACTNIIENMNGTIRQVTRNVKRWRDASMALRWTAAGMMEARKGFRRLKATSSCQSSETPCWLCGRHAGRPLPTIPVLPTLARPRSCQIATPIHLQHQAGHSQRMPRTQGRNRHVPDGLSPRTGTGWAAQAPNAGRVRPSTGARCGHRRCSEAKSRTPGSARGAGGNFRPYRDI